MNHRPLIRNAFVLLVLFVIAGCWEPAPRPSLARNETLTPPYVAAGDLAEIRRRGELRVLRPLPGEASHLPRRGPSLFFEKELIEQYAERLGLRALWVYVDSRDELIPHLLQGKGDVIVANLTATPERKRRVRFTVPVGMVREQLVVREGDPAVDVRERLAGRRLAVRRSASFWTTALELQREFPTLDLLQVPETLDTEEIIHRVAAGTYDLTIADSNLVQACLEYRDDIQAALDLTSERPIAWAVRPDAPELLRGLDRFLNTAQVAVRSGLPRTGDLPQIKQERVLRVLTRNTAATYFLWRGELRGFEYELLREFARREGLRLEVIVPPAGEDLLAWLRTGRGDVVAASLTPTLDRRRPGIAFTRPYNRVEQVVVTYAADDTLGEPADLAHRTFHVRRDGPAWATLERIRRSGVPLRILPTPASMPTEEIIARVAEREYDLTLSESHVLSIELGWRDDVRGAFPLLEDIPLSWAVRRASPRLRDALDAFIRKEHRSLFYNVVYDRYFTDDRSIRRHATERASPVPVLSPYDELVKKYAAEYGFDWRLIVSLMYQESRFDPTALSFAGAQGLMQVLPRTAGDFGFDDLLNPEVSIHAGVRYLDWVRDRFEPELPVKERMWFTLAAYNAGAGHVRDARRLAAEMGLDPNSWFDNVEEAMLLLSRPQYASRTRHGYCRCNEPVEYVRDIRSRFNAYVETLGSS